MDTSTAATGAQVAAEQKLAAAHQQLLHTPGLQFQFKNVEPPKPPDWLEPLGRLLHMLAPAFKYIFWGGLAVAAAFALFLIGRELWRVRFGDLRLARKSAPQEAWRPQAAEARALLDDADRLAGEGRFDEAVHLILFRTIEDLAGRKPGSVKPALTSRDIAAVEAMPASARNAFTHIAQVVEGSFFGGRGIGRDEFSDCRTAYERFAFAEGWA